MSERINVDHAFDPEARQAQADFDAYLDSRRFYADDNNKIHDGGEGQKFATKADANAYYDAQREAHFEASAQAFEPSRAEYYNESLDQIAQRVADARQSGDTEQASQAEEVFFEKFNDYAEKYGWENEVIDESATGNMAVDKDAKVGRDTIDARLERYGKIMYGEAEPKTVESNEGADDSSNEAEASESSTEESLLPEYTAEEIDRRLAGVEEAKARIASEAATEPEYDSATQQERMDARLPGVSEDGLTLEDEPTEGRQGISEDGLTLEEDPAEDGESLEEYEARHGVVGENEPVTTEQKTEERKVRFYDYLRPDVARVLLTNRIDRYRNREKSGDDEENEKSRKGLILGVLGVTALAGASLYFAKYGFDLPKFGGGNGGDAAREAATSNGGGSRLDWNDFDSSARRVTRGEGWFSTFKQMGIPKSEWNDVLTKAGPKLGKLGEAYFDNGASEWRISRPGQLSNDALRVIASASRKNGVEL